MAAAAIAARHAEKGLGHDGDGGDLQTRHDLRADAIGEAGDTESEKDEDDGRRQGEGGPGGERPEKARARQADGKADLARGRAGQELAERDEFAIGRIGEPAAPFDELIAEIAEMGDGPAKGGETELEKGCENLAGRALRRSGSGVFAHRLRALVPRVFHVMPARLEGNGSGRTVSWLHDGSTTARIAAALGVGRLE